MSPELWRRIVAQFVSISWLPWKLISGTRLFRVMTRSDWSAINLRKCLGFEFNCIGDSRQRLRVIKMVEAVVQRVYLYDTRMLDAGEAW